MWTILKASLLLLLALALLFTGINAAIFAKPWVAIVTVIPCVGVSFFLMYTVFRIVKKKLNL